MTEEKRSNDSKCEEYLEKIIKKEIPLRDPSISVVHIAVNRADDTLKKHQLMLRKFKGKFADWTYKVLNVERVFFDALKARDFIDGLHVVKECDRKEFENDVRNAILSDVLERIENEIEKLKTIRDSDGKPPFLVLVNMHSTYPLIETGDIISRIINQKGVYVIILYINEIKSSVEDPEPYRHGNYTVHSCSFT